MFCFKCGASMPDDSKTCPQCATPVQNAPAPPPAGQPPSDFLNPPPAQQQYPQSQPYPQQPQYYGQQPHTDGKAIASLILGIASILFCLNIFAGIPAIILGHISRGDIQRSMGRLSGGGIAMAGLILGYFGSFFSFIILAVYLIPNLSQARIAANEGAAIGTVRTINISQTTYRTTYPENGYAPDLATLGPGPSGSCSQGTAEHACLLDRVLANSRCAAGTWCNKGAYRFSLSSEGNCHEKAVSLQEGQPETAMECNFVVVATPISTAAGSRSFCSTSDNVVRYRYGSTLSGPISVEECAGWSPIL